MKTFWDGEQQKQQQQQPKAKNSVAEEDGQDTTVDTNMLNLDEAVDPEELGEVLGAMYKSKETDEHGAPLNISFLELMEGAWDEVVDGEKECPFEWESGLFDSILVEGTPAAAPTQPTWEERQSVPVDDVMAELFGSAAKRSRSGE